jgi:hypothetical protein
MFITFPVLGLAQDATPAADPDCVPITDAVGCLPTAPDSARVDLVDPTFADPTNITNPLFPVNDLHSVLMLGHVDGKSFRTEVTLLPWTQIIDWNGQQIETRVSQYMAYLDGRVEEVAYDYYAQADDGAVWYLGEDVADYEDGAIISTEGTWRAGSSGAPGAMIMPADPQVGDAFRTENIPGFVFEEVTVTRIGTTVTGPHGSVSDAIVVSELHQEGTTSEKVFAPGYGEFRTGPLVELEALALAVPMDALSGPVPTDLETLSSGALAIFDAAVSEDWSGATGTIDAMSNAWDAYRADGVPSLIEARLGEELVELVGAVVTRSAADTRQAAINVAQLSFDLKLRFQPPGEIDLARMDLWARQLLIDAAADEPGAVNNDVTTLEKIRERISNTVETTTGDQIDTILGNLRTAADDEDLDVAVDAATRLRDLLATL